MTAQPVTVLVLHEAIGADARADDLDTLNMAGQVVAALRQLGRQVSRLQTGLDLDAALASIRTRQPGIVFNLVESLGGNANTVHFIPALLRAAGLAFTGSDSDAIYLSSQKLLAKRWMRLHGIPTPASSSSASEAEGKRDRWIVKSLWEHASFGMDDGCVVNGIGAARKRIADCVARYGGEWFAESFVDGREFNIAVLEQDGQPVVLPIAEMGFTDFPEGKPKIVGYAAKWDEDAPEFLATERYFPALTNTLCEALTQVAHKCWQSFGMRGYARVDIRLDGHGKPWVLEVNANPSLCRDAGFAAAAQRAGIGYGQLIETIVTAGIRSGLSANSRPVQISQGPKLVTVYGNGATTHAPGEIPEVMA